VRAVKSKDLLGGKIVLRPDDRGEFDELLLMEGDDCRVHMEMMSDDTLWIGIYPKDEKNDCVHVTISANGKLRIVAHEA